MSSSQRKSRQAKSVPLVYGGLAGVLLIVIAAMALVLVPPAPPQVAEFAPQATEQIEDAPESQSTQFGAGAGGCAAGQVCDPKDLAKSASSTRAVVEKARVRRCVGDPPRQIEDPQSPPCVNYFEGDNGGATSRGVTSDEIRYAISSGFLGVEKEIYETLAAFFNTRFEFYGRRIRLVTYNESPGNRPENKRANATAAYEAGGFIAGPDRRATIGWGNTAEFWRESSRLGMVAPVEMSLSVGSFDYSTFTWSYLPPYDVVASHLSEFNCKSLVGKTAKFAGGAEATRTRRFAVFREKGVVYQVPGSEAVVKGIGRCGGEAFTADYTRTDTAANRLMMTDIQQRQVTTIIIFAEDVGPAIYQDLMPTASSSGYQPEWLLATWGGQNRASVGSNESVWQLAPKEQVQHLFGLLIHNKGLPHVEQPYTWAFRETGRPSPDDQGRAGPQTSTGHAPNIYREMLMVASGIQSAGPNLTPESFERGLQRLRFSNPAAGDAPYYQAKASFAGKHWMVDDVGLGWWSPSAPAYAERVSEVGGWCYVGRGTRWSLGKWPTGEPNLFDLDPRNCR